MNDTTEHQTSSTPPQWGILLDTPNLIYVCMEVGGWTKYVINPSLMGGMQWHRLGSAVKPQFIAPDGTPIPDPNAWPETHKRLCEAIEAAVALAMRGSCHHFRFPCGVPVPSPADIVDGAEVLYVGKGIAYIESSREGPRVWFDCGQTAVLAGWAKGWFNGLTVYQKPVEWLTGDPGDEVEK